MQKGANNVAGRLRIELKRRGIDDAFMVNTCDSIELCDIGPNVVVYPEGHIYCGVQVADIPDIIASLQGGPPLERLLVSAEAPAERKREAAYRAALDASQDGVVPAEAFEALVAEHGFDEGWVAEQARRGFIGRKEVDGRPVITITSKARTRYRLTVAGSEATRSE